NVTVQWSIIAEGLDFSVHSGARKHSKGILLGSGLGGRLDNHFTLHHNLIAHNRDRMPDINNAGITDYVNNVMYNPKSIFGEFYGDYGENYINFVGNYMKKGPDTSRRAREIDVDRVDKFGFKLYLAGNIGPRRRDDTLPEDAFLYPEDKTYLVDAPLPAPPVATTSAEDAYRDVLEKAGATVPKRDPVDARIVTEVEERSGRVPNHPDDVGGYPDMRGDAAPLDTDQDGMSDEWEQKRGLDLYDPGDRNGDADGNGYTDLEDYLNELAGDFSVAANSR
ncbi:MAG: Ig-like domain-containing protein, partial [Geminicoccaceae bacterium]